MIMKQFNLDEYLANPSRKVVTRDGRSVKIHCTNYTRAQNIIAQIEGNDYSASYHKDGIFINGLESNCDIVFATERKEGWINIYRTEGLESVYTANVYNSKEEAEDAGRGEEDYLATIKIEWEE